VYGYNCVNGTTLYLTFWSLWQWNANSFNNFTTDITVSPTLATCKTIQLFLGRSVDSKIAVLVDDVQIAAKVAFKPTPSPSSAPVSQQTLPTITPSVQKTLAPTTSAISCPLVTDGPMTLSSSTAMINFAGYGVLCTLAKATIDSISGNIIEIVPLARSYDGYMWELAAGDYAASFASTKIFSCYNNGCQFWLPQLASNEWFQLRTYEYTLSERDQLARMLERTSFGITQSDLESISSLPSVGVSNVSLLTISSLPLSGEDSISNIDTLSLKMAQWIQMQITTNVTSHREFWRQRANPRVCYCIVTTIELHVSITDVLLFRLLSFKGLQLLDSPHSPVMSAPDTVSLLFFEMIIGPVRQTAYDSRLSRLLS
jgi:hypothetical protein